MPAPLSFGFRRIARLVLAFVVLFGCGRRSNAPGRQPVTVSMVGLGLDAAGQLRRQALDEFTGDTGIRADLIPTWGTSTDQLALTRQLLRQHSATPDVYVIDAIWPGSLAPDLLNLAPYLDADARSHWPALLDNDTVQGRIVALPFYVNIGVLYYRTDLLRKYGYARPPRTWMELRRMAARIQRGERAGGNPDFWGYLWQGDSYEGLACNALEWQASYGGGRVIETDGTITVNNPRTAQAFHMAEEWIGRISPPSVLYYNEADSLNAFRSGNAAFLRYWGSGFGSLGDVRGTPWQFSVTSLPAGPHGRAESIGGFELAVSRYTRHPREAARLVLYLTGPRVQFRRALHAGYFPTIPRLYESPQLAVALPQLAVLPEAAWVTRPSTVAGPRYAEVSKAYYQAVHDMLSGKTRVEPGLAALAKQLAALTGFPVAVGAGSS